MPRVRWRPKHIIFPPAKPAGFIARRSRTVIRFRTRRPLTRFYRPRHIYGISFVKIIAKQSRTIFRFRSQRPLKRFFRHKVLWFNMLPPVTPVGFIARPNKLRKVKRKLFYWPGYHVRHKYYQFPGVAIPVIVLQKVWRVYLRR